MMLQQRGRTEKVRNPCVQKEHACNHRKKMPGWGWGWGEACLFFITTCSYRNSFIAVELNLSLDIASMHV